MSALHNPVSIIADSAHPSSSSPLSPGSHRRNTRAQNEPTKSGTNPTQNQSGAIQKPGFPPKLAHIF